MPLTRKIRIHIWLRLLLLQSSWNFERLQGLGFYYVMLPALKNLYSRERLLQVSQDYIGYFNTHPYLAPTVVGAVARLEEERSTEQVEQVSVVEFKEMVAAPFAAVGDALFWGGLRPLAAGVALFVAAKQILWAPVVFLLLFNAVPTWFRLVGYVRGYRQGIHSVEFMQRHRLPDWAIHTKEAAIVILGGLSAFLVFGHMQQQQLPPWIGLLVVVPIVLCGLAARKGVSTLLLLLLTSSVILLVSLFWADFAGLLSY